MQKKENGYSIFNPLKINDIKIETLQTVIENRK